MKFLALDLGASDTRYCSNDGEVYHLPNNMVFIPKDADIDLEPYTYNIEDALDVTIFSNTEGPYFPVRALLGTLASRYTSTTIKPSVMMNKHEQQINYVSAITAAAVDSLKGKNIDGGIRLYLALPPIEVYTAKEKIKQNLIGRYKIIFNKLAKAIEIEITDVSCYEESFMAILSYFFDTTGKLRENAKKFKVGNILSLDIGASTTDLIVVKDLKILERSGQTYKIGGNIAREYLKDDLRALYGFDVPDELADAAMVEGRIQLGNQYEDISQYVQTAKQKFAAQVVEQMQSYFRKINIPIQSIRAIVVSGGGSMRSEYQDEDGGKVITSEPMSFYITKELSKICPGIEVEPHVVNPRLANIYGLFIRANIDIKKRLREQEK